MNVTELAQALGLPTGVAADALSRCYCPDLGPATALDVDADLANAALATLVEISGAPYVEAITAAIAAGLTLREASAVADAMEAESIRQDERWGAWSKPKLEGDTWEWETCTGRTLLAMSAHEARLTRRLASPEPWRAPGRVTAEVTWAVAPDGVVVVEGWVDPVDDRAGVLPALPATPPMADAEGEEVELEACEREARERAAAEQAVYSRSLRARRNGGKGNRARDKARKAARRHKARITWDQPVA